MTSIAESALEAAPTTRSAGPEFQYVKTAAIVPSKTNPRKAFPPAYIKELADSMGGGRGILEPLIVRPHGDAKFEIVAGECRWRAAKEAGLDEIPIRLRPYTDQEVLEIQLIENLQRKSLHPLEEADGYRQLLATKKYDAARIAERVGMSVKYVYDRIKLLTLIKEAQDLFRKDQITAGHAILLARLRPDDQERAIEEGLFTEERLIAFARDEMDEEEARKPVSVREFQSWVDGHVKFEQADADPMLFPETAEVLKAAAEDNEKVVRITRNTMTPEELKNGPKAILGNSWKRADGKAGSKTCERSVIGNVVIGTGRGEALRVCVDKKGCAVHWPQQVKAAKKQKTAATKAAARGEDPAEAQKRTRAREQERQQLEDARWEKAMPAVTTAIAAALKKAPAGAKSALGQLLVAEATRQAWGLQKEAIKLLPPGKGADSLVRFLGLSLILNMFEDGDAERVANVASRLGVDVKKMVAEALPPLATCRECGCTEAVACAGGCAWLEEPDKKTGKGLCSSPKCAAKRKGLKPAKAPASTSKRQAAAARA